MADESLLIVWKVASIKAIDSIGSLGHVYGPFYRQNQIDRQDPQGLRMLPPQLAISMKNSPLNFASHFIEPRF